MKILVTICMLLFSALYAKEEGVELTVEKADSLAILAQVATDKIDSVQNIVDSTFAQVDSAQARINALRKEANELERKTDSTRHYADSTKAVADSSKRVIDSIAVLLGADSSRLDTVETVSELDTLTKETIDSLRTELEASVAGIDSIYLKNNDIIVGELQKLARGILWVETEYSDKDFQIEWDSVSHVVGGRVMFFVTKEGKDYYGTMRASPDSGYRVTTLKGRKIEIAEKDLITLENSNMVFIDRFTANVDLGFTLKKANSEQQFNGHAKIGFNANRFRADGRYDGSFTLQDSVSNNVRNEGVISANYFFPKNWYVTTGLSWLNSTESKLKLRTIGRGGFGKYVVRTNELYLSLETGFGGTRDIYYAPNDTTEADPSNSEFVGYVGTKFDMFDFGDIDFLFSANYYYNISSGPRNRIDGKVDLTYDLPLDFYLRVGFIINYDSRPSTGADHTDYQLTAGFGWEY